MANTGTKVELTDQAVLERAEQELEKLKILAEVESSQWDKRTAIDIVLEAATTRSSIEAVCTRVKVGVSSTTIRTYLNKSLKDGGFDELEREANQLLVNEIPRRLWKHPLQIAIDCHDEASYGKKGDLQEMSCGGEAKAGTTRFFRIATAYVIFRELRVTLAVLFVRPEDRLAEIVASLLRRLQILGISIKCLYCDRGFCSIPVLRFLDSLRIPAIVACPIRGKTGGTRKLCQGEHSYLAQHTFRSQDYGQFTANLAVARTHSSHKKKKSVVYCLFVILHQSVNPASVLLLYKNRFGIESSYRSLRKVKALTTSPNSLLRFFFLAIALFLINLWTRLRFLVVSAEKTYRFVPLPSNFFPFHLITFFISQAVRRFYGTLTALKICNAPFSG